MDDVGELPEDLTRVLYELGARKLVLLEGVSDVAAFREWYLDRRDVIEFFSPDVPQGGSGVRTLLARVLAQSTSANPREFGIVDRDFRSDAEVEASLSDAASHLFILRRYCIENYLLEPVAVTEEVRVLSGTNIDTPDLQTMEIALLGICRRLQTMMAANWVCSETGRGRYYAEGHEIVERPAAVRRVAEDLACSSAEAEAILSDKEQLIEPLLSSLETAHRRINGKHLLFQVYKTFVQTGICRDKFRNLLARAVKRSGLHEDVRAIVELRILA